MFKTTYDPEADVFAVYFGPKGSYVDSQEVRCHAGLRCRRTGDRHRGAVRPQADGGQRTGHRAGRRRVTNLQLFAFGTVA
jgi:hypothetical protein